MPIIHRAAKNVKFFNFFFILDNPATCNYNI